MFWKKKKKVYCNDCKHYRPRWPAGGYGSEFDACAHKATRWKNAPHLAPKKPGWCSLINKNNDCDLHQPKESFDNGGKEERPEQDLQP